MVNVRDEKTYTERTAFVRTGEDTIPASNSVRRALEADKGFELIALNENIKFELSYNLRHLLTKSKNGVSNPSMFFQSFRENIRLELGEYLDIETKYVTRLVMALVHAISVHGNLSTQFIDSAIESGKYLNYNYSQGHYERSQFLDYLHELQINIRKFDSVSDRFNLGDLLEKYNQYDRGEDIVTIKCDDFVPVVAMLARYENVTTLSIALLAYLLGDDSSLENIQLNPSSPLAKEAAKIAEETPTDDEILEYVLNRQNRQHF